MHTEESFSMRFSCFALSFSCVEDLTPRKRPEVRDENTRAMPTTTLAGTRSSTGTDLNLASDHQRNPGLAGTAREERKR